MPQCDLPHNLQSKNWTETVVFPLEKYSRANSRPNLLPESIQSTQPASQPVNPVDWSHFNQPRLSLFLDIAHTDSETVNTSGSLALNRHQKIILKIIWDSNPQSQQENPNASSGPSEGPGVFQLEKINLTEVQESFGHLRMGEIPLKANCKDKVVAIRYATEHMAGSFMFNRIQIKLQTLVDCFKFIAILETICPCKMTGSGISSKMQTSQDPRNNVSPLPGNINPSDSLKSSQVPVGINKTSTDISKGLTELIPALEPGDSNVPDFIPLQASHQQHETRKLSPVPSEKESRAPASFNHGMLPGTITDLNNLPDELLMVYVKEIITEPGFDSLVKHVKKLMPHE